MVDREKQHTDLLIRSDGAPPLVIENKVFALPDSDQLDRIAAKFSSENPHLVLLSLTPPAWAGQAWTSPTGHVWIWMSYKELIERLGPTVPKVCAADHYAGATLDRWLRLIGRLGELVELVGQPAIDEPVMLPRQQRQLLETARLDAPVQKMRCQRIASELTHRDLAAYAGLTNGTGLVAWFTDSPHGFVWGWQLQGKISGLPSSSRKVIRGTAGRTSTRPPGRKKPAVTSASLPSAR